jgi:hypothetical protein
MSSFVVSEDPDAALLAANRIHSRDAATNLQMAYQSIVGHALPTKEHAIAHTTLSPKWDDPGKAMKSLKALNSRLKYACARPLQLPAQHCFVESELADAVLRNSQSPFQSR